MLNTNTMLSSKEYKPESNVVHADNHTSVKNKKTTEGNAVAEEKKKKQDPQFNFGSLINKQSNVGQTTTNPDATKEYPIKTEGILTPVDNFAGRSMERFGVGEKIVLDTKSTDTNYVPALFPLRLRDFTSVYDNIPTPKGYNPQASYDKERIAFENAAKEKKHPTAAALGGFQWSAVGGGEIEINIKTGKTTFIAPALAGSITLNLKSIRSGKIVFSKNIKIIEPNSGSVTRNESIPLWHINGRVSAGFIGNFFLGPKDVSFSAVQFLEGTCPSVLTGGFLKYAPLIHIPGEKPLAVAPPNNIGEGSKMEGMDRAQISYLAGDKLKAGTMSWNIPWIYLLGKTKKEFTKVLQSGNAEDITGKMYVSKDGSGSFSQEIKDPTFNQEPYSIK
jgi:hypothetical protein